MKSYFKIRLSYKKDSIINWFGPNSDCHLYYIEVKSYKTNASIILVLTGEFNV